MACKKKPRFFLACWTTRPMPTNLAISGAKNIQIWSSLYQIKDKRQKYLFMKTSCEIPSS